MPEQTPSRQELKKLKIIYLLRILQQETDDEHGLTGPQIISRLAERGVEVERKTLYRDLECLRKAGYDIQQYTHRRPPEYGLVPHEFPPEDLLLMADAVQSSKSITLDKANDLVGRIGSLGSKYAAADLRKRIHVAGRIQHQQRSVFYNIDSIQQATDHQHQIRFTYYKYDEHKRLVAQHGGKVYRETPVQLLYKSGWYYLITWREDDDAAAKSAEGHAAPKSQMGYVRAAPDRDGAQDPLPQAHGSFRTYRVDRMHDVEETDIDAVQNETVASFDIDTYLEQTFNMYSGQPTDTRLRVKGSVMSSVIDRFGTDVRVVQVKDGYAVINVTIRPAPTFFGWLAQFGTDITIEQPVSLREAYRAYLNKISDSYE